MKKIISAILCAALLISMCQTAFAALKVVDDNTTNFESSAYKQRLEEKGLTEMNIKSLASMGFSFEEQANLDTGTIQDFLGETYGKTSVIQPRASFINVTNVPDDIYGKGTESFLSGCGFVAGDFYTANDGNSVVSQINAFAAKVFKNASCKKFYYLYGEYDSAAGVHKGVDLQAANNTPIFSAHTGNLVRRPEYGAACIQNSSWTNIYAHMSNLRANGSVSVNNQIGNQSNVSPNAIGSHLHFEVRNGQTTSMGDPYTYSFSGNKSPYWYMVTPAR
ncbi:M23 family metallopeptidase [Hydrogenoanaerobacterium sp.]|uniref:M23 family metallopeptidase n=1 Tax=Hydrogenoanaerobacterium sp. TaxID=2953763 RepID=UPI0028A1A6DB|nr:M23 family metallopeptidase [Hydrogenoanaerobacterium sp.]